MAIFRKTTNSIMSEFTSKIEELREHAKSQFRREEKLVLQENKLRGKRVNAGSDGMKALAAAEKLENFIGDV